MVNGNGNGKQTAPEQDSRLFGMSVLAQYIKHLSFDNPQAPASLAPQAEPPQTGIRINVGAVALPGDTGEYEVTLDIQGKTESKGTTFFEFGLVYAGVFRIKDVAKEDLHPTVMIECPRILFPFAREIVASLVRNCGYPQLVLNPVDFIALYRHNMAKAGQAAGAATRS